MTENICPGRGGECATPMACTITHCAYMLMPPLCTLHFVGFKEGSDVYDRAVRRYGEPDFIHRIWDHRARAEIMPGDAAIFHRYSPEAPPCEYTWDDSAQPDDPATRERG
jgi:hypothetical protein